MDMSMDPDDEIALRLAARRETVKVIADEIRVLHKVHGGVCLLFLEAEECPFAFAIPMELESVILPLLPGRLREVADRIERGMTVEFRTGAKLS